MCIRDSGSAPSNYGDVVLTSISASGNISASGYIYSANEEHWEVSARVDCDNDTNWQGPNNYGIHTRADWNYDYGTAFNDITATVDVIRTEASTGWRVPYSASIIGFDLMAQPNSNVTLGIEQQFTCSLWHAQAGAINTTSSLDANMGVTRMNHICSALSRQHPANTNAGMFKYNMYDFSASAADNSTLPYKVAKGDWIYPRFRANLFEDDGSDTVYAIYLSVKYKRIIG